MSTHTRRRADAPELSAALALELATARAERDEARAERDALRDELTRVRAELSAYRSALYHRGIP